MTTLEANENHIKELEKNMEKSFDDKDYSQYLTNSKEMKDKVRSKIQKLTGSTLDFWKEPIGKEFFIPVNDGEIRVFHIKPENAISKRPVIFISGWGTLPFLFKEMYEPLHERVEFYYVETREKRSSHLNRKNASLSLSQKALDIQAVIDYLSLNNRDFVLIGTCWGAAIILQGLLDQTLKAPSIVTFAPMHKLWFNKFILKNVLSFLPIFILRILFKIIPPFIFLGMKEKTQKRRNFALIKEAEVWKWKKAAIATADFELFGKLSEIQDEVFVISGTNDRVHDENCYPRIADELPKGRFFYFGLNENEREHLLGLVLHDFSEITSKQKVPDFFVEYEKFIN
ncbi:MAG TPA: alpha/beta hydrolase [candidate division Zixibacteria bacterium]|nr:alpha/beta hydrolase [candidate division Zixibacteria bacterium]